MSNIDRTALRQLDLTVLLVFLAMMRHRKVVSVAAEMGLTQSAISHSLKRLRQAFSDPLFLRQPHGMEPTSVALALEPVIRSAVEMLDAALRTPAPFEPATAEGTVQLAANDNEIATLLPALLSDLHLAAPGLRVSVQALDRRAAAAALASGEIDLALGFFPSLPASLERFELFEQGYRVVARAEHPQLAERLDLETYLKCRHVIVSPRGDLTGIVDAVLEERRRKRVVSAAVPFFMPALETVATTDLIATLPERLVIRHGERFGLSVFAPPLALRAIAISAIVHKRNAASPLHTWLIGRLNALFG